MTPGSMRPLVLLIVLTWTIIGALAYAVDRLFASVPLEPLAPAARAPTISVVVTGRKSYPVVHVPHDTLPQ